VLVNNAAILGTNRCFKDVFGNRLHDPAHLNFLCSPWLGP
jgi:hypothetical protein